MPLIFITENSNIIHKTAGAVQQAHIPFTILNLLLYYSHYFSYKTIDYRKKVIDSYNSGYRNL